MRLGLAPAANERDSLPEDDCGGAADDVVWEWEDPESAEAGMYAMHDMMAHRLQVARGLGGGGALQVRARPSRRDDRA